ncbi:MAG: BlaI/MecI/CopY family transcriptional regulator [Deltaproteobacteria bacterium]|nr:BlaI/MecI/CopY family transcriptional regulator [Deltaproteobacteria bacterium]MBK8241569.1 BlaI/MecI/CopY family transcriptional regulator [Deltaproteobacteria bacterium]MBK8713936.1 BlaI/MecI/CopY family transcriptional regulator [Deltaproteobacteria bacterium]MBP7289857.1 BlaI/MecI/CopY family transcriptional regulator [Nannocystaceae bacterium]
MSDAQLSDLQLALLRVLWDRDEATAADVHEALREQDRALAPTTVATLLQRLEKRGLVTHTMRGRSYVYRASVPEHEVRRTMLAKLTEFFFGGNPTALVSHLLGSRSIDAEELAAIDRLLADRRESESEDPS